MRRHIDVGASSAVNLRPALPLEHPWTIGRLAESGVSHNERSGGEGAAMRLLALSVSAFCAACLGATCAMAQILPYETHVDRRHGHDHVYPDRGAVVRDVPRGAATVNYAGLSLRFAGGVWYQRQGPAYIVVAPPIGVVVPRLPAFATRFESAGRTYLYADDVFYRSRPDLGGYEVVNDPQDEAPGQARARGDTSAPRLASVAPSAPPFPTPSSVQAQSMAALTSNPIGVAIRPRNGQSSDRQAIDRYECYRFAVTQTGFDPIAANSGLRPAEVARLDSEYSRAQAACLEGRGYTLR